jgi:beta-glucosidase/6-phospho-beta-glucosidase/beta-galactosidase
VPPEPPDRAAAAAPRSLFGDGFAIGVTTAGYQVEGGYNGDGEPANNWSGWEQTGRAARSGVACGFWAHPEEALDRAAAIGCNTFRLSVEWARLEPEAGCFDEDALARYGAILELCRARGLEPMVALHHFTHPWWLGEEFWLRPGSPDLFAHHVQRVMPVLAPLCRRWVTLHEPNVLMARGWIQGVHPPGRRLAFSDALCVLDNLLTAHVLAADAVRAVQPDAAVTCTTSSSSLYEQDRLLTDLLLVRAAGIDASDIDRFIDERRALHDAAFPPHHVGEFLLRRFFASLSPYGTNRQAGGGTLWAAIRSTTRRPVPRRVVEALYASPHPRTLDAVGFDWSDPIASHALRGPTRAGSGHRREWSAGGATCDVAPDAEGLHSWMRTEAALHPGLPLWVVEKGTATRTESSGRVPRHDDWDRARSIREHLGAVVRAVDEGIPVAAYLQWSLMDTYEWGTYEPRYGIFGMDRTDPGGAVRWMDTDAQGRDAGGAFRRVVRGLLAGDRSALEAPSP